MVLKSLIIGVVVGVVLASVAWAAGTGALRPELFIAAPWTWSALQTFGAPVNLLGPNNFQLPTTGTTTTAGFPIPTFCSVCTIVGSTRAGQQEFVVSDVLNSTTGVNVANGNKVAHFAGGYAFANSGPVWGLNTEGILTAQIAGGSVAYSAELDAENFSATSVNTSLGPTGISFPATTTGSGSNYVYGEFLAGGTVGAITAASIASGSAGGMLRGYGCINNMIQSCFYDYSSAAISVDIWGTHTTGVDFTNATISGNTITSPGFNVVHTGKIVNTGAPTSCAGQPTGTLWNNAGVANFCP